VIHNIPQFEFVGAWSLWGGIKWIGGKIYSGFSAIGGWFLHLGDWIWNDCIVPALNWIGYQFGTLCEWLGQMFVDALWELASLASALGIEVNKDSFVNALNNLYFLFDWVNWFVPLKECIIAFFAGYTACLAIRGVRWAIGLVPFIGG
jgi:hypothetical protein